MRPPATTSSPAWRFGFGRADITVYEPGMTMMGWGMTENRALGVAAPLHARAAVLGPVGTATPFVFVVIDTMMVTEGLRLGALAALAAAGLVVSPHTFVLAATHTHSGPSGFAHHLWTNLSAPGFSPRVFDGLVRGIVAAVRDAFAALAPGHLALGVDRVPLADGTAFNRSWFAYNRNPEVTPVTRARRDEATDRLLTVLRCHAPDGRLVGLLQWFGLHATTVHSNHTALHPDYKGLAALALEAAGLHVVLAQECCGDVTPNHRRDRRRGYDVGPSDDDLESAAHVAASQERHTRRLAPDLPAPEASPERLSGPLQMAIRHVDFSRAHVHPDFSPDGRAQRTRPALLGLAMAEGTAEGPGPLRPARALNRALAALRRRAGLDPKVPFLELSLGRDGRLFGRVPLTRTPPVDPLFRWVRDGIREGRVPPGSWVPQVLPIQLIRLGRFAILAIPFETTTVAGRRLRALVADSLPGVDHVVVSTYAGAYVGYLTTFEEYAIQHYEAAYNVFGPHTLGALMTAVRDICAQLGVVEEVGPAPAPVDVSTLEPLLFREPWPSPRARR